jgi:hypothetical protein
MTAAAPFKFRRKARSLMPAQENIAVIRRWVDAINRNDIDAELACWQPDGEFLVVQLAS